MFTGLSAFPLTPLVKGEIDENAFVALIEALAAAGVNSIGALGSTGSYAYLTREQRFAATRLAVSAAAGVPVMTSIGSVNAEEIVRLAEDAQKAGVSGLLLAPLCYQKLTAEEVFRLYERLCGEISVPLCIYDNPATSGFEFNDELLEALSFLPNMGSIKLGDLPADPADALARVAKLKSQVAAGVTIGISGDAQSAAGLLAGCDVWYSVLAGLFPDYCLRLTQAALRGDVEETRRLNGALEPLWRFFRRYGSLRVIATVAELRGRAAAPCLPFPLQTLAGAERDALQEVAERVL
ncbi:dihydrodipicolinate synthase family protein [Leclercia adecarboxylata]|uniref:dihydrodipicolinate synthase family protein n=2 Tax=Enterobacteriaceae TaxID=543 RepID=UPI0013312736|nr:MULTISPECIES: dihydrodipicolinate synthase family protein [Leclercia]MCZ7838625.1 dihydrodipicolinate synthase family protein [Leclercia adecarboxylata]MEB5750371.1 dihydrodipicolinate synthase family protein [Leclercia adecarboxylata]QVV60257.1 dihydrodipicolinate synthase family protein [Leclercia sp. Colony189]UYM55822.1 dihydrodipicolinate synthase family protein [Leclercia adecarboxylata]